MSYSVWIVVEDDEELGDGEHTYWSVDHFDTKEEAIEHAEAMAEQERERTGVEVERLDD